MGLKFADATVRQDGLGAERTARDPMAHACRGNGNTQIINVAGGLTTYSWDVENRMTQA